MLKKLKLFDYLTLSSILITVVSCILILVGCLTTTSTGVGINLNLSPLVYVGVALDIISIVFSVYLYEIREKKEINVVISYLAMYLAEAVLILAIMLIANTILSPILHPTNG